MRTQLPFLLYAVIPLLCSTLHFFASREVKLLQVNLKKLQVESNMRDAKLYANMFDRTTKESDVVSKVTSLNLFLFLLGMEFSLKASVLLLQFSCYSCVFHFHFLYEEEHI